MTCESDGVNLLFLFGFRLHEALDVNCGDVVVSQSFAKISLLECFISNNFKLLSLCDFTRDYSLVIQSRTYETGKGMWSATPKRPKRKKRGTQTKTLKENARISYQMDLAMILSEFYGISSRFAKIGREKNTKRDILFF